MARHRQRKSRGRGRRGGASPLDSAPYPGSNSAGQWNASVGGNQVASAANNFKSFLGGFGALVTLLNSNEYISLIVFSRLR